MLIHQKLIIMKKITSARILIVICFTAFYLSCSKKNNPTPAEQPLSLFGKWKYVQSMNSLGVITKPSAGEEFAYLLNKDSSFYKTHKTTSKLDTLDKGTFRIFTKPPTNPGGPGEIGSALDGQDSIQFNNTVKLGFGVTNKFDTLYISSITSLDLYIKNR